MTLLTDHGKFFSAAVIVACLWLLTGAEIRGQNTLRARAEVLGASTPFSYPERIVVGPDRNLYVLDRALSSIFIHDVKNGKVRRLCGPDSLGSPSDLSVSSSGELWVLSARNSKVTKVDRQCVLQAEISIPRFPLKIATNFFGELIVLNATGPSLFDLFSAEGKLIRSFGQRFKYADEVATYELSDGSIAADSAGGFFFSFNYPPLVRHYARDGRLLTEFKPESDVTIAPPNITVAGGHNSIAVSSKYQILVLDMAADKRDRLYLLISGKNKVPAIHQGTPKLRVVDKAGRTLKSLTLDHRFHRLAVGNRSLYLLRNREPLRVDEYIVF